MDTKDTTFVAFLFYSCSYERKSTASISDLFPDLVCNIDLLKNHKIAQNSATTKARKNKLRFGILIILE
jgi:hypothetical protein